MVRRNNPKAGITKAVNIMAKIVTVLEGVLIAGSHFEKGEVVNCDDGDADQLISIKRARLSTPEEVKEARDKAKKNDVAKVAPTAIGAESEAAAEGEAKEGEEGTDKEVDKSRRRR
jgi:hypothetical protein